MEHQVPPRRRARGYILLETVVTGVITATAIVGLIGQLSSARIAGIAASREQTASRLAASELEDARARASTIVPGVLRSQSVAVGNGQYTVRTVAEPEAKDAIPARGNLLLTPAYVTVRTEVAFTVGERARRVTASTRLYR
ncbi:MAG TPA: type II secretion system protein [Myxococcota bacterium]